MHSQYFEIVPYDSPGTSGARPCGGNNDGVDGNCDGEAQGEMTARECNLRLCNKRLLVLRSNITPCDGVSEGSCLRWSDMQ